ncbi:uncharacterized protein LOC122849534 isoform X2 [Aphidius gifuensis]|uniref:uncharacterized protein LOC122849534 isoform X2 n=1 Tax=Aphidius gifuensis TaxID=684658 RepID=UPI001CDB5C74|nr:uncharacterized protein LOC122849534 isoform X2 [Aphidius gifuensis]
MIQRYVIWFLVIIKLTFIFDNVHGHVALTFPQARKYDIDFLDNARTPGPCGMPKGDIKTSLLAGSKFNITWHLAYPHQGGFRLQILDALDRPLVDLTPVTQQSEFVSDDATAQYYPVELPQNFTCIDCTVRLLREAAEWGSSYRFWSCSDVDIVEKKLYRETCSGHGRYLLGRCKCDALYHGSRCEYHEECMSNSDCGDQGKCIDNGGTTSPTKHCYCNNGWFGRRCNKLSPIKSTTVDFDSYSVKHFSNDFTFYWRILEDIKELEGVMVVNGTSWVGIGWRSSNLSSECRSFPDITDKKIKIEMLPQPEPKSEPEINAHVSSNGEPTPEISADRQKSEVGSPEPEPSKPEPETSVPEPENGKPEPSKSAAKRRSAKPHTDVDVPTVIDTDTKVHTSVTYQITAKQGRKKRSPEPASSEPTAGSSHNKYTPKHDFHSMDCTDMIIGSARGNTHRIGDYYTRDRSTPRFDDFWGGKESLTGAMGYEKDGVTTILFRRKLSTNDLTDHDIVNDNMHVIWAKGQEPGKYQHRPSSGIEKGNANIKDFYKQDELKYHGHNSQRGVESINFFDEKNKEKFGGDKEEEAIKKKCSGEWRYPRHCSIENATCDYYIEWTYKTRKDEVTFIIVTKESNTWTGVGFSNDRKMSQTDAIIGWIDKSSGMPFLMDTWISGYTSPVLDGSQDTVNHSGKSENGISTIKFTRKRISRDTKDLSFTDDHCLYMMFPVKGGEYNQVNKKIKKHASIFVSSKKVCIRSCGIDDDEEDNEIERKLSNQLYYDIEVKLLNLPNGFKEPQPGTQDFDDISKKLSYTFGPALNNLPGYSMIKLSDLQRNGENSVIAKMSLILDKNEAKLRALRPNDTVASAEIALKQAILNGRVGSLTVDPQYLVVRAPLLNELSDDFENGIGGSKNLLLGETKLYIVAGCVAALVAIALLQATCTVYKATRKRTTKPERLIGNNAWRDYTTGANTNFAFEGFETEEKAPPPPVSSLPRSKDLTDGVITRSNMTNTIEKSNHNNRSNGNSNNNHYHHQQHPQQQQQMSVARATYSLPRAPGPRHQSPSSQQAGYYTQDRRNQRPKSHHVNGTMNSQQSSQQPDFYFMPSQRKYSGEVVRVYVDYGNQKSK